MKTPSDQPRNPLSTPDLWDQISEGYDEATREFLGKFSQVGLSRVRPLSEWRVLDVACGPGTTTLQVAPLVARVDALDFSRSMLDRLQEHVTHAGHTNVVLHQGDGHNLPFAEDTFDCAVSMFGLMFFGDRPRGLRELLRVLRPRGRVMLSSWAPIERSPVLVHMFDALRVIDPSQASVRANIESLENPDLFRTEVTEAGFVNVELHEVECDMEFADADAWWRAIARGAVPALATKKRLGAAQWAAREELALAHLRKVLAPQTRLWSTAYLVFAEAGSQ
jgi:ubiquinone/menaquinone biosynthesis C-methylase UbiE